MSKRPDPGGGGLTGATGDLTPDDADEPFVPAERREQAGERAQGSVTHHQATAAPAQQGDVGQPGADPPGHGPLNREGGYGSQHGLSPNDPAYRMEVDSPAEAAGRDQAGPNASPPAEPRAGVDDISDHEERF